MVYQGFVRVAAGVPSLRVADCTFNAGRILALMERAEREEVAVLVFPELCITGYTCADLFHQERLRRGALDAVLDLARSSRSVFSGLAVIGLPLAVDDQLFNCAAVLHQGRVLGVVPKSFIPNYKEFYERRWFAVAATARSRDITLDGQTVPFGTDQLFAATPPSPPLGKGGTGGVSIGVEICEDLWVPVPPSCFQALSGANVLVNLSASNELIGKSAYRRQLVLNQSGRCLAAYVYASSGVWESTTDVVFGGHCLIAENGVLLGESRRFQRDETLLAADIDLDRLRSDRMRTNSFGDAQLYMHLNREFRRVPFRLTPTVPTFVAAPFTGAANYIAPVKGAATSGESRRRLYREVDPHPFVPWREEQLRERCEEIFHIQVAGLAKRIEHIDQPSVALGVSGGLDSTLALLVACRTVDQLKLPRSHIRAFTMPGFGTSPRTRQNALSLMQHLRVSANEIDIRALCLEEMRAMRHRPFGLDLEGLDVEAFTAMLRRLPLERRQDLVFENVQARMRMNILMNSGFVIGTGDISELALGWCTYGADHMSMYNPNASIPKTLVKFLVQWAATNEFDGEARRTLLDIVATEISPELLPTGEEGTITQVTEATIGPYELHDFFLFHFLRYGSPPEKILYLAEHARFDRPYASEELRSWLRVFIKRFFASQFKRSCLPDGPKVGSVSLSPRGDWRMPSDAESALWLEWLAGEESKSTAPAPASDGQKVRSEHTAVGRA